MKFNLNFDANVTRTRVHNGFVKICVYFAEDTKTPHTSDSDNLPLQDRYNRDMLAAKSIWEKAFENPYLPFTLVFEQKPDIPTSSNITGCKDETALSALQRTDCSNRIAVYYVSTDTLDHGSGCSKVIPGTNLKQDPAVIILSRSAQKYVLAHELGHLLFGRQDSPPNGPWNWNDPANNPYINPDGSPDYYHNNDPNNLMYPNVPINNPQLTDIQIEVAIGSMFIQNN
ncbi:ImmA/IrrE family metallo-endopeptidase [Bacillus mycoides]|uniref:ImmA/IrrE family metallo-endopeptidase n=1 Tax=Bacillus mycoides TaxID=1405 RepID=UPI00032DE2FF|nr:hypothetical protein [Bacillus mycoides]EOO33619.1 hypothetical protein IKK_05944 [Bacillus mycoides]KUH42648.1 hypothetical protein M2E15_2744 [Bacillus mycoides]QWH98241.1 hypothetical protein EXW36_30680 [Bacillus mycoides]